MEFNIEKIVSDIDFLSNELVDIGNGIMLTNKEITILDKYNINYAQCGTLKEILLKIEEVFCDECGESLDDLDDISISIAERDYYENTNK